MTTKLRPMGTITSDLENLLCEMVEQHDLQMGEVLALVKAYMEIHLPDCVEVYEDNTTPVYYYGPKRQP